MQKIAKKQAQNEFFRRLKKLLAIIDCGPVYDLMSRHTLELLYHHRFHSLQVAGAKEDSFHTDDLKWFKKALVYKFKKTMVNLDLADNPNAEVEAYVYLTVGLTLKSLAQIVVDNDLIAYPELAEKLLKYHNAENQVENYIVCLDSTTQYVCSLISDLRTRLYWTNSESSMDMNHHRVSTIVTIHGTIPERIHVTLDNETRKASQLVYIMQGTLAMAKLNPEKLGLPNTDTNSLVDVYLLEHALNRLVERNDCVYVQYIWYALTLSVYECRYHIDKYSNRYMIEFAVYGCKTGYLVGQVVDNKLIIRTFLLLSYDGTPEGRLLHANVGLSKADKEYLKLDKLSTFISPEIYASERIRKIFDEAGCQSLFQVKAEFDKRNIMLRKPASASLIEDYLMLNEKKEEDSYGGADDT
ncbi:MAG: hypothetical protein WCQ95_10535 [Bacteroidota bacterium]